MCTVSMIGDFYGQKFQEYPWYQQALQPQPIYHTILGITREEFDALKKEVLDMKELLKRAKLYDEKNGEPDCEMDSKMAVLRKVAEAVGVNLEDVLKPAESSP